MTDASALDDTDAGTRADCPPRHAGPPAEPARRGDHGGDRLAIPCDAYSLFAVDPDSLLFTRVIAGSGGRHAASRLHRLRHTYLVRQPGLFNPPGMMQTGGGSPG